MPLYVFPKHHVLSLNAKVSARSAMKKSTMIGLDWSITGSNHRVILFGKYNIFAGFGEQVHLASSSGGSFARVQLCATLARHVKVF